MSETPDHIGIERLQAYVEDSLDRADRAVVASHLVECADCSSEVEELHSLFGALSGLVAFTPAPGFGDRVMAKVRVRQPIMETVGALVDRVTPQSTRGWAAATAVFALPLLAATALAIWLTSQPGVTAQGLWIMASGLVGEGLAAGWQWTVTQVSGSALATWVSAGMEVLGGVGRGELGLAVVLFTTLTAASIWVLYQNLFRTEARRNDYASYVF